MEENLTEHGKSLAAPAIFILVFSLHFVSKYLEFHKKKKGSMSELDVQLRAEIKQVLKEASSLTQPSTFARAAKLRRMAAAKEKELAKNQEMHDKDMKLSFGTYEKLLTISKVLTYVVLILWFWKIPITTMSDQLVQPFGKLLSWRSGAYLKDNVVVGIIPWLILPTRCSGTDSVLKKQKRAEEWAFAKAKEVEESNKKKVETRKLICKKASDYAQEYENQDKG